MSKDFNLLDEPWLPVRLADGRIEMLGLLEVFSRSAEITALAETAPPSLVAQYRLLLAILHRALKHAYPQGWKDKDRARWWRDGFPIEVVNAYLEHWRERFWLFHPEHPFMQVAALASCTETQTLYPPNTISLEQFYGSEIFNQDVYKCDSWHPGDVIKSMLGYFQFVPGGFFPGKKLKESEKSGALANTAAIIPAGGNLAQTLLLSLHKWTSYEDLPAWERAAPTLPELRGAPVLATGPNDRYTRQSRAVLLRREADGRVRWLHFAAGLALEEDSNAPDPMVSFHTDTEGNLVQISFMEGRAFWRDLPVLVPNPQKKNSQPAAVLNHAMALHAELEFDQVYQPLLVAGLASNKAKLLRWRLERINLPISLMKNADRALYLCNLVEKSEKLFGDLHVLAVDMLMCVIERSDRKNLRESKNNEKKAYKRMLSALDAMPFAASYFAYVEHALPHALELLTKGEFSEVTAYWDDALRKAATISWEQVFIGLGCSIIALRVEARLYPGFHTLLNKHLKKPESNPVYKEAAT